MEYYKNKIINLNKYAALNFSTKTFTRFWNLIFFITRNQVRFKETEDNNIIVQDKKYKLIISQKLRAWFYFKSLKNRFESLGKMYHFDKIEFSKNEFSLYKLLPETAETKEEIIEVAMGASNITG